MKRRQLLAAGLGAPLATLAASAVRAEGKYPDHIVRLVVPFAPAGPTDIIGRKTAEKMTALLGQTMIVDNKAGAAGSIGAVEVKNAKPDGYTLLFAPSSTHAINPTAFVHPAYDAVKDFTPISSICVNPLVLVTHPSMPDSVMGLVEEMKKNPGKYSYAGHRQHPPSRRRVFQTRGRRHGRRACALSRLEPGGERSHVGPGRVDVRDLQHDPAAA